MVPPSLNTSSMFNPVKSKNIAVGRSDKARKRQLRFVLNSYDFGQHDSKLQDDKFKDVLVVGSGKQPPALGKKKTKCKNT